MDWLPLLKSFSSAGLAGERTSSPRALTENLPGFRCGKRLPKAQEGLGQDVEDGLVPPWGSIPEGVGHPVEKHPDVSKGSHRASSGRRRKATNLMGG